LARQIAARDSWVKALLFPPETRPIILTSWYNCILMKMIRNENTTKKQRLAMFTRRNTNPMYHHGQYDS